MKKVRVSCGACAMQIPRAKARPILTNFSRAWKAQASTLRLKNNSRARPWILRLQWNLTFRPPGIPRRRLLPPRLENASTNELLALLEARRAAQFSPHRKVWVSSKRRARTFVPTLVSQTAGTPFTRKQRKRSSQATSRRSRIASRAATRRVEPRPRRRRR